MIMTKYKDSSALKSIGTAKGKIEYQEFSPGCMKPALDEIDVRICELMGLSSEQLDFLINYDIKFRISGDGND